MKFLAAIFTTFVFAIFGGQLLAQQSTAIRTTAAARQITPAILAKSQSKKIGFRLTEWKTLHAPNLQAAQTEIATLKRIGCEVLSEDHGNHIDVRYRCTEWKALKLTTDQLLNQWSVWCESKGLETVVINPPSTTRKPTVRFRMPIAKTIHLNNGAQAKQILNTLELIGCQINSNDHGNHIDATFVCPAWTVLELPSEESAHGWLSWLKDSGFETQHAHSH